MLFKEPHHEKTCLRVSEWVRQKPGCTTTEDVIELNIQKLFMVYLFRNDMLKYPIPQKEETIISLRKRLNLKVTLTLYRNRYIYHLQNLELQTTNYRLKLTDGKTYLMQTENALYVITGHMG